MAAPKLKDLHKALVDTLAGYEEAKKKTESAQVKALCDEVIALRERDHAELHGLLNAAGEKAADGPSLMAKVQETVIDARAAITGVDENALPAFIRGEESIVEKYDDAINEASASSSTVSTLTKQKAAAVGIIAKMKAMKPA